MVRCKFKVVEKSEIYAPYANGETGQKPTKFKLQPVYGDPIYGKATPTGQMEMLICNDEASAQLEVGKDYYIDISPAE